MKYRSYVFDCDGVLLASNAGKSHAFYLAALPYGDVAAARMVELHRTAGSISRRERWDRFFAEILQREPEEGEVDRVVEATTVEVRRQTSTAALVPGVLAYLERLRSGAAHVVCVSGIETAELLAILKEHGLDRYFDKVLGGPRHKREVLLRAKAANDIEEPGVYYGDAKDDAESAGGAGLDFVLVEADSEWPRPEARDYLRELLNVSIIQDFRELDEDLPTREPVTVLVDAEGFAEVDGERRYVGVSLRNARVTFP